MKIREVVLFLCIISALLIGCVPAIAGERTAAGTAVPEGTVTAPGTPTVNAVKSVDKASALPGDTLNYTVVISDTGSDAVGVAFNDTLDSNLTYSTGTLSASPVAANDYYNCTGNLSISVPAEAGVLANDYSGLNPAGTISAYDTVSTNGAAVSVAADGSFTYEPVAGYAGTDTFTYTLLNTTGISTAVVTVGVSNRIWFINNDGGACTSSCDGRFSHPFTSLTAFIAAGVDRIGDKIFIYSGSGSYSGNLSLKMSQRLIGQGDALNATTLGFTPAPYSPSLPGAATKPTLTGSLTLANGVTVLALDWNTSGILAAISGVGVSAVTIADQCTITAGLGGAALYLNNADGNFTFKSISSNVCQVGITWNNTVQATGSLTVTGDGSLWSGGIIESAVGPDGSTLGYGCCVYLNKASNVSLHSMLLNGSSNFGVRGFSVNNFTMDSCAIMGESGDNAAYYEGCISFGANTGEPGGPANGLTGSATISNCTILGGFVDNIRIANQSGTLNRLSITGTTIGPNSSSTGNDGVLIEGESGAVINVTVQSCTISGARGSLFAFILNGNNTADLVFQNNALSNPAPYSASAGSNGLSLISGNNVASGAFATFNISNNSFRDANGHAVLVVKSTDPGTLSGTLNNNIIGVQASSDSGSAAGDGIKVQTAGLGTVTVNITNNRIYQYNNYGIELLTGGGAAATGGTLNAGVRWNIVSNPGTGGLPMNGFHLNGGTNVGDTFQICADITGNTMTGSGANGGTDFRLRQRQSTTIRLPGYAGANNDNTAVQNYVFGLQTGNLTILASNTVGAGGGGFVGGAACAQPSTFAEALPAGNDIHDIVSEELAKSEAVELLPAALSRLASLGFDMTGIDGFDEERIVVEDLPAGILAEVREGKIFLDRNASGRGWFIDPSPYTDEEYERSPSDGGLKAVYGSLAENGVDLLSVMAACAADISDPGHSSGYLRPCIPEPGVRCLPAENALDENGSKEKDTAAQQDRTEPAILPSIHVESGETVSVSVGTLPAGKSVTLKFAAVIENPLVVPATSATNQANVSGSNFTDLNSNTVMTTIPCPGVPVVTGISPSQGPQVGGTTVAITGTGLLGTTSVTFGATPSASFIVNGDTSITAVSPAGSGIVDIRVATPCDISAAASADLFAYRPAPVVITVLPPAGPEAGGTVVTITGSGFTGATAVNFGPTPAVSLSVVDDSTIQAVTPPGGGTVEVHVTTPGGTSGANPPLDRFTYLPVPVLYSVFPSAGPQTGGTTVNLTGSGFTGATSVNFGATPALSYLVSSDITITAVSPPGTGTVDVIVTTPGGISSVTSADRFTYFQVPVVYGVAPSSGPQAGGTLVTLTGSGFTGASAVNFGATPTAFAVVNDTTITAVSPAGSGTVDVTLTTPGGTSIPTPADRFTYCPVPVVMGVAPSVGSQAGGTTVSITGIGFTGATAVNFGATPAMSFLVVNDTTIQATSPPGFGNVDVRVTTPGGTSAATPSDLFIYCPIPIVMSVLPPLGPQTGGTTVTINGIGFMGAAAVSFGATPAASFLLVNDTTIQAVSPAGTGTVDVTVTTPGGTSGITLADRFNYCPPISLSPPTLPDGVKGSVYDETITATGGTAPHTFAVTAGALPNGLTLDSDGTLHGTPAVPGTVSFTVTATDSSGCTGSQAYTMNIACATLVTNLNDSGEGSLREAVANSCVGGTITFAPGLTGVIQLTSGFIPVTFALTIQGPGASVLAIDGGGLDRVFYYFNNPTGALALSGLTIRNGSGSVHGGGIYAASPLILTDCVVSGCVTSTGTNAGGGGIYAQGGITMDRCTVSGNQMTGGGYGGGLEVNVVPGVVTNCTFSGNHASGSGGGIEIANTTCTLLNCTITQNSVAAANPGGGIVVLNGTLNLKNSIVAGNGGQAGLQIFNSASTVNDNGGNITSGDPLVAPLEYYGGPMPTHALLCGSPALDAGINTGVPSTDQRLVARPQGSTVDIGAFEANMFLNPAGLPDGQTGAAYSQTITATGGTEPYTFTAIGTLPSGFSLAADGSLTGTPTALGSWAFIIVAKDSQGFGGACSYTIAVTCGTITVSNPAISAGTVGTPFSQTFTQVGGIGTTTFSTTSALPAGLTLASNGTLSGTPTVAGTFPIIVKATDTNGCEGTGAIYNLIIGCQAITVANPVVTTATVGAVFNQTFTQVGGIGTTTFSTTSALPAGLTLASNGILSGTPTVAGTFPIAVKATDTNGCEGTGAIYNLVIGCQAITVANPAVTTATVGAVFNQTFTQVGGIGTTTFSTTSALPAGLTLASNGILSGTPTVAGTFPIAVKATDTNGCEGTGAIYNLVISCQAITVANPAVTTATVGAVFNQTFTQVGGIGTTTFSTTSALPAGLTLALNGTLSGTPTVAGTFPIIVKATDANGCYGTGSAYTLVISCQAITVTPPAVSRGIQNVPFSQTFTQSGGIAPVSFSTTSTLPSGLSLSSNGTLSGTPTNYGSFPITITATDTNGCAGSQLYTLVILQIPGAPVITAVTDNSPCGQGGISITFTAGSPATRHDLYRDGALVVSGVSSPIGYNPGDTSSHSYVVRAINTDDACFADSAAVSAADANGTPTQPVITGITDVNAFSFGLVITYTPGSPATRHDLYRDGVLVVTGFVSGGTYNPLNNQSHSYSILAVNGSCSTMSGAVTAVDRGSRLVPRPRLPLEPIPFPH